VLAFSAKQRSHFEAAAAGCVDPPQAPAYSSGHVSGE